MSFPSPEYSQSTHNDSTQSTNTYTDVDEDTDSDMLQLLDSIPFDAILSAMMDETETEDDRLLSNRGYFILNEVTPTLQGTLFKAKHFSLLPDGTRSTQKVAIKRICRKLHEKRIFMENGISFVVDEDIVSEAQILKEIQSIQSTASFDGQQHVVQFVDFFSSTKYHYLVTQWIDSPVTLQSFIRRSWRYIESKQLSKVEYNEMIQCVMWQLVRTVHWLHTTCHVSHSDLCLENILLDRDPFIHHHHQRDDESYPSSPFPMGLADDVNVKLVDFGVAQRSTLSIRDRLNVEHTIYQCPQIYEGEAYDPRAADCWSIGLLLYSAITGLRLYTVEDITHSHRHRTAYRALKHNDLREYLKRHELLSFSSECLALICGLLTFEERSRLSISDVLVHRWFAPLNVGLTKSTVAVSQEATKKCGDHHHGVNILRDVFSDVFKLTTCYQSPNLIEWSIATGHQR